MGIFGEWLSKFGEHNRNVRKIGATRAEAEYIDRCIHILDSGIKENNSKEILEYMERIVKEYFREKTLTENEMTNIATLKNRFKGNSDLVTANEFSHLAKSYLHKLTY